MYKNDHYYEAKDRMARSFDGRSRIVQPADGDVDILANRERTSTFTMAELSGLAQRNRGL